MKEHVSTTSSIWFVVLLISVTSIACSLFTRAEEMPTPTDDYIFPPVTTPLRIEPDSLPHAQTGVEYEVEIHILDNVTPVNHISISDGIPPAGLELVFVDGVDGAAIRGTPREAGTYTFTVFVSCFGTMVSGQTGQREYVIVVK